VPKQENKSPIQFHLYTYFTKRDRLLVTVTFVLDAENATHRMAYVLRPCLCTGNEYRSPSTSRDCLNNKTDRCRYEPSNGQGFRPHETKVFYRLHDVVKWAFAPGISVWPSVGHTRESRLNGSEYRRIIYLRLSIRYSNEYWVQNYSWTRVTSKN